MLETLDENRLEDEIRLRPRRKPKHKASSIQLPHRRPPSPPPPSTPPNDPPTPMFVVSWYPPPEYERAPPELKKYLPHGPGPTISPRDYYLGLGRMTLIAGSHVESQYQVNFDVRTKVVYAIVDTDPICIRWQRRIWPTIKPLVDQHIDSNVQRSGELLATVDLLKLGFAKDEAPKVICIGLSNAKDPILCAVLVKDIVQILSDLGEEDLHVEVFKSTMMTLSSPLVHPKRFHKGMHAVIAESMTPCLGLRVATLHRSPQRSGTLGFFFTDGKRPGQLFATASRHVLEEEDEAHLTPPPPEVKLAFEPFRMPVPGVGPAHHFVDIPGLQSPMTVADRLLEEVKSFGPVDEPRTLRRIIGQWFKSIVSEFTAKREGLALAEHAQSHFGVETRAIGRIFGFHSGPSLWAPETAHCDVAVLALDTAAFSRLPLNCIDANLHERKRFMEVVMKCAQEMYPEVPNILGVQADDPHSLFDADGMVRLRGPQPPEDEGKTRLVFLRGASEDQKLPGIKHQLSVGVVSGPDSYLYRRKSGTVVCATGLAIQAFRTDQPHQPLTDDYETTEFSAKGDSGGVVFDASGRIVGLIYGANPLSTYAVPITAALEQITSLGMDPKIIETPPL